MDSKAYRLPDPEKQPESFLVILYKTLKRIEYNDRAWDKHYFARCMKRTKELLEALGDDVKMAAQCMQDLKDRFEADGTRWTIETVIQYSFEWKSEHERRSDRDCLRGLVSAYADKNVTATKFLKAAQETAPAKPREPDVEPSDEDAAEAHKVFSEALAKMKGKEVPK